MSRLVDTFSELVQTDSESRNEEQFHTLLLTKLKDLGLDIYQDEIADAHQLGGNNIVATYRGTKDVPSLFFSTHTDTVKPGKNIEVIEKDGILYSKGDTILAADNKAGIAIVLEAVARMKETGIETGNLEFVFSPGEEIGLIGSAALDMSLIQSEFGYVLDSAGEVGRVTVASPHLYMYEVTLTGRAAHAGLEPEKGLSVMNVLNQALTGIEIGRIDAETTTNIGTLSGGEATNIVMENLTLTGEVRSIDDEKAQYLLQIVEKNFLKAAYEQGATVSFTANKMANGFNIAENRPVMHLLKDSLTALDLPLIMEISGGGSDANSFNFGGKEAVNLSIGYDKIHTKDEFIVISEMERAVQLVIELAKSHVGVVKKDEGKY